MNSHCKDFYNNWKLPINQKMKKTLPTQYKKDLGVTAIIKERKTP